MGRNKKYPKRKGENVRAYPHEKAEGVFWIKIDGGERRLATKNFTPGHSVYGEKLFLYKGKEYREWDPRRSKLSAYLFRGGKHLPIKCGDEILYLGAGSGTTASHISDIIGGRGKIYCVEFASRVMRELIERLCTHRSNVYPILADARFPERYPHLFNMVDGIYCDIAQPEQAKILSNNSKAYLKKEGWILIALKARSIDVSKKPKEIFQNEIRIMEEDFKIKATVILDPYEKDHAMVEASYHLMRACS